MKCPRKFILRSIQEDLEEEEESLEDFGNTDNPIRQIFAQSSFLQNNRPNNKSKFEDAANLRVILSNSNESPSSITLNIKINPVYESSKIFR